MILNGFSGSVTSTAGIDAIIAASKKYGFNCYRIACTASWTTGTRPYNPAFIQYFLDHSDLTIIVDRNHRLGSSDPSPISDAHWAQAEKDLLEVCSRWKNVYVEFMNEDVDPDLFPRCQHALNTIRNAGYTNGVVMHKHWQAPYKPGQTDPHIIVKLNDPLNKTYQGIHHYFNETKDPYFETTYYKNLGVTNLLDTEVGANYNESSAFTTANVKLLSDYLAWKKAQKGGACIWLNKDIGNLPKYEELGLIIPPPDNPCQQYIDQIDILNAQISSANSKIATLNTQVSNLVINTQTLSDQLSVANSQIPNLQATINSLNSKIVKAITDLQ